MDQSITRKDFLRNGTKVAAGAALGVGTLHMLTGSQAHADKMVTPWPWPYQAVDVEAVRILGHDAFWEGKGCSYGAFHAIAAKLRLVLPDPWNQLPSEVMIYGHGGGVGWGATCGALNGPAALISLALTKARSDILISDMYGWYTQTLFPTDISNQYAVNHVFNDNRCDILLPQNAAGSPLCHPSVTEWCKTSSYLSDSLQRKERCARITGDVAAFAAQILNEELGGTFVPRYVPPAIIAACMSCHGTGPTNIVAAKMECTQCHGTNPHVSAVQHVGDPVPTYKLGQNYPNPFNPSTNLEFSIPKSETVSLSVYDVHGRLVRNLVTNETFSQGTFKTQWDGTNDAGMRVATGIYFARLSAGTFNAVQKMNLIK
ncbi:MAG: C-GCAxxG-C-C family protein [Bacteroidetes bacterium]|nr:C-GCAxxG-C-C family protein [Bacteroidota bacterium]MCW5896205.1 C-GCAxxG-C-C family protein [Bacteroidota bacterium]